MRPPEHPLQTDRLQTLRSYDILDTPRESDFDEIVALAARICEAPISVINLIDKDRQWFKAEVGLGVRETPIATSICAHVILQDDFVEIPDTLLDKRMADNPLCNDDPGLRFYAGARLIAPNGLPIGTLCVLDNHPRGLNELQRQALSVLSRQVMMQLELRSALKNQKIIAHEADHRVKNSLQTLSSIMRLYKRNLTDTEALKAFEAVERRVQAVGALHGQLQGSETGSVSAKLFMDRVVQFLDESIPDDISISCQAEDIPLRASAASALGMIVSEFVSNSVKHGFSLGGEGEIRIMLERAGDGIELRCLDNGSGSATGKENSIFQENLGSKLVKAVVSGLNGEIKTELTAQGSRLLLTFKV